MSVVITGDFDGVKVEDNTSLNMSDMPGTEPAESSLSSVLLSLLLVDEIGMELSWVVL